MKKIFALVLALALFCGAAFAAEIRPLETGDLGDTDNAVLCAEFSIDDVTEKGVRIRANVETRYPAEAIEALQVGDTLVSGPRTITVDTLEQDDGVIEINEYLWLLDDGMGNYILYAYDLPCYMAVEELDLEFADEVTFMHWQEDADGGIMDEMLVKTVPAAEMKAVLTESGEEDFEPAAVEVTVADGLITAVTVNYTP